MDMSTQHNETRYANIAHEKKLAVISKQLHTNVSTKDAETAHTNFKVIPAIYSISSHTYIHLLGVSS